MSGKKRKKSNEDQGRIQKTNQPPPKNPGYPDFPISVRHNREISFNSRELRTKNCTKCLAIKNEKFR